MVGSCRARQPALRLGIVQAVNISRAPTQARFEIRCVPIGPSGAQSCPRALALKRGGDRIGSATFTRLTQEVSEDFSGTPFHISRLPFAGMSQEVAMSP